MDLQILLKGNFDPVAAIRRLAALEGAAGVEEEAEPKALPKKTKPVTKAAGSKQSANQRVRGGAGVGGGKLAAI